MPTLIRELATWLHMQPGGLAKVAEYATFQEILPEICAARSLHPDERSFTDFNDMVTAYVAAL